MFFIGAKWLSLMESRDPTKIKTWIDSLDAKDPEKLIKLLLRFILNQNLTDTLALLSFLPHRGNWVAG